MMKKIVIIASVVVMLFSLTCCVGRHDRIMNASVSYAKDNIDLLKDCADSLKEQLLEISNQKEPDSYMAYKVELQENSILRLYDYTTQRETEIENKLCQQVLSSNVIDLITVHFHKGVWSVEFSCGGYGFGPDTKYYAIQIITSDDPSNLWHFDDEMIFVEKDNGFWGSRSDSDNSFYYFKIADGVYYTEAAF